MLTQARLKELLHYDPETGVFTRLENPHPHSRVKAGEVAGGFDAKGYRKIWVHDGRYMASVLAWLYMTGRMPKHQVDHKDLNKANNRWLNLRPATNKQNQENTPLRRDNTSGCKGVWWRKEVRKWKAMIRHNGKLITLGYRENKDEAIALRKAAEAIYFTHHQ